jgi:hypothetical protein
MHIKGKHETLRGKHETLPHEGSPPRCLCYGGATHVGVWYEKCINGKQGKHETPREGKHETLKHKMKVMRTVVGNIRFPQ